MSSDSRGDILFLTVNDVALRIGKSNHLILNPEAITETYNVNIPSNSLTVEQLGEIGERSNIRAFKSFATNVVRLFKNLTAPVEKPVEKRIETPEPKVITVTRTVVERDHNVNRLAIYAKLSSIFKVITFLFIIALIMCVVSLVAMKPKIQIK